VVQKIPRSHQTQDAALAFPGNASEFLEKVWHDAVGFCGTNACAMPFHSVVR
jgi:5-methylthioribose kinase